MSFEREDGGKKMKHKSEKKLKGRAAHDAGAGGAGGKKPLKRKKT